MSNEEHLAENAIMAYNRNKKDYYAGLKEFDCELNRDQAMNVFCNLDCMASIYEIAISAYEDGRRGILEYMKS